MRKPAEMLAVPRYVASCIFYKAVCYTSEKKTSETLAARRLLWIRHMIPALCHISPGTPRQIATIAVLVARVKQEIHGRLRLATYIWAHKAHVRLAIGRIYESILDVNGMGVYLDFLHHYTLGSWSRLWRYLFPWSSLSRRSSSRTGHRAQCVRHGHCCCHLHVDR